ncbi:Nuclear protein 1 [Halotydeus destructor]|nr:Nuclear protein 1 [Halotydeus destructor]
MSEAHFDDYEHFNYDQDKFVHSGHSGKQRSKREAMNNTNRADPSGHSRKLVTKLQNTETNHKVRTRTGSGSSSGSS